MNDKDTQLIAEAYTQVQEGISLPSDPEQRQIAIDNIKRYQELSDPNYIGSEADGEEMEEMEAIEAHAEEYGYSEHLEGVAGSHWPKEYGRSRRTAPTGYDELAWRKQPRITKGGKMHSQDIAARKNELRDRFQ